ncbi:hypothetical protein [Neptunomonas sp. XY-337]|uniref:hypothetical protein n=1 Tax=Neptunomonas sp. XY-337 TaxID=2561897 RepID=UPI0010AB4DA8|nr:hypothetical protein [Neptunomonas sp. XY-337]
MKLTAFTRTVMLAPLFASSLVHGAVQSHSFTLLGNNGEVGSGSFTWDDVTVPNGGSVGYDDLLSFSLTLNGGNVVGGSVTFEKVDCDDVLLLPAPDFTTSLNVSTCSKGGNSLMGETPLEGRLAGMGPSVISFYPGSTSLVNTSTSNAQSIPTLPFIGLALLGGMLGVSGTRKLQQPLR